MTAANTLTTDAKALANAVLPSKGGGFSEPAVQVSTFAAGGVQANDMMVIQRTTPESDKPNIVLYAPENEGASFHEFADLNQMNTWLKQQADTPASLDRFASHFSNGVFPEKTQSVKDTLTQFRQDDINAVVGPYGKEDDDIFHRLDSGMRRQPPAEVNGLTNFGLRFESPSGQRTYSGQRPDGETVNYSYDAYGNLIGAGDKDSYFFQKNALNNPYAPLAPLTEDQFARDIKRAVDDNVGANDLNGLYQEFIHHLENPAYGISGALQRAGVPKDVAAAAQSYLDNPIGSALVNINKAGSNWFGKQLGRLAGKSIDEADMNKRLDEFGKAAQTMVGSYGRMRQLGEMSAKALKGEPPSLEDLTILGALFKGFNDSSAKVDGQKQTAPEPSKPTEDSKTPAPSKPDETKQTPEEPVSPEELRSFATPLKPDDLASMHKGFKDIYTNKAGEQYALVDDKVYRVHQLAGSPNQAYVLNPDTQLQTSIKLDHGKSNAWQVDNSPRLLGGGKWREFSTWVSEHVDNLRMNAAGKELAKDSTKCSYFSQGDYKSVATESGNPLGVCQGCTLEAMRRIDRGRHADQPIDLYQAVKNLKQEGKSAAGKQEAGERIGKFQDNPNNFETLAYDSSRDVVPHTGNQTSLDDAYLYKELSTLRDGGVAVVGLNVIRNGSNERYAGHSLAIQRTGTEYQLFEPNNGVFKYADETALRGALTHYGKAAFADRDMHVALDTITYYQPK